MIKVLLADDQQLLLDGMISFLEKDEKIQVHGTALNGDEVLNFLKAHPDTDVVVMDVEMPVKNGIETTRAIREDKQLENIKVLILSMYNKKEFILKLMEAGANGYILKDKGKEQLIFAIYNVHEGKTHFGLEVQQAAFSPISKMEKKVDLTERELDVLCLIAEGMMTREIATKLFISEPTVNTHRRNLLRKLDVPNDKHLVRYAIKKGLVEL